MRTSRGHLGQTFSGSLGALVSLHNPILMTEGIDRTSSSKQDQQQRTALTQKGSVVVVHVNRKNKNTFTSSKFAS